MNSAVAISFGVICTVLGMVLFLYRMIWMCVFERGWNNQPTVLSWASTWSLAGLVLVITLVATPGCGNGCPRVDNYSTLGYVFGFALALYFPCAFVLGRVQVTENTGPDPDDGSMTREKLSGYDFLLITTGLALLVGDTWAGNCVNSCN